MKNGVIVPANRAMLIESRPTSHKLIQGDARNLSFIADESVHLIVTSPPYWTLKRYNDIEYILMQRKPGGYRKLTEEQRQLSMIPKEKFDKWFQQFWNLSGASTKEHPAPFPLELALRLVQMFSFVGDTVVDPFCGTAT